jgi:hypothetical protein
LSRFEGGNPVETENGDVGTIDAIVTALYESISGPAGPRDWARDRKLYAPGAILMPAGPVPTELSVAPVQRAPSLFDFDGWVASRSPFFAANDFYEWEVARKMSQFGNIAHVLSAYEARRRPEDRDPIWRGINSLQLFHDGRRWWIVSILWDNERPDNPMPSWANPAAPSS